MESSGKPPLPQAVSGVGGIPSEKQFGAASAYEPAQEEWLIEGYLQELASFRSGTQLGADPAAPRKTFISLFAALAFEVTLIERVLEPYNESSRDQPLEEKLSLLQGIRYVRNRVQHQWAIARGRHVPRAQTLQAGAQIREPAVIYDWFWKPLAELPEPPPGIPKDPLGRDSYKKFLAGKPARQALEEIEALLRERGGED